MNFNRVLALTVSAAFLFSCKAKEQESKTNFNIGGIIGGVIGGAITATKMRNLSPADEKDLGKKLHKNYIKSGQFKIHDDPVLEDWVRSIGVQIVPHLKRDESAYTNPDYYEFIVVDDKSPNAFATLGGYTYVTTGLLSFLDSEAALAGVIAHELGHLDNKDSINKMADNSIFAGALQGADLGSAGNIANLAYFLGTNKNSRDVEFRADKSGMKYLKKTNYAPSEMLQFFEKLKSEGQGRSLAILSTHPNPEDRLARLKAMLKEKHYEGAGKSKVDYESKVCYRISC